MIYCYGQDTLDMTMSTLIKFMPPMPIYILNVAEPDKTDNHARIESCAKRYPNITIERATVYKPLAIRDFAANHPELDFIFKTDDDMFYTSSDTWDGIIGAYNKFDGVLFASGLPPLQRWILPLVARRLGEYIEDALMHPNLMRAIDRKPELLNRIWDITLPPEETLAKLRKVQPRFITLPDDALPKDHWIVGHYYIKRTDLLKAFNDAPNDQRGLHQLRQRGGKIAIDTHSLVYHYSNNRHKAYSDKHILPRIQELDFWKLQ